MDEVRARMGAKLDRRRRGDLPDQFGQQLADPAAAEVAVRQAKQRASRYKRLPPAKAVERDPRPTRLRPGGGGPQLYHLFFAKSWTIIGRR